MIAIDCECVSKKYGKREMLAFRVAAISDCPPYNNQSRHNLLYHSFWDVGNDFIVYAPVVGITFREIKTNIKIIAQKLIGMIFSQTSKKR